MEGERRDSKTVSENMHKLMIESLRHREQDIFRYLVILGPALGGFMWLLYLGINNEGVFTAGVVGVLLLLLLGALYSLALGYNYRYIVLQLGKLEKDLHISETILKGWPKSPEDFIKRYSLFSYIPWCTPPEVIKIFWFAFIAAIIWIEITIWLITPCTFPHGQRYTILIIGIVGILLGGFVSPVWLGFKLHKYCKSEGETISPK